jgi:hypothetical protein
MSEERKLILLAGADRRAGFQTLDMKGSHDFIATVPPLPEAVKAISWDRIELIHGITQFYPWDAEVLVREIFDALRSGGTAIFEQPNLIECLRSGAVEWLYGDPSLKEPEHMVKWAYTGISLRSLMYKVGFKNVVIGRAQYHVPLRDFRLTAVKS